MAAVLIQNISVIIYLTTAPKHDHNRLWWAGVNDAERYNRDLDLFWQEFAADKQLQNQTIQKQREAAWKKLGKYWQNYLKKTLQDHLDLQLLQGYTLV